MAIRGLGEVGLDASMWYEPWVSLFASHHINTSTWRGMRTIIVHTTSVESYFACFSARACKWALGMGLAMQVIVDAYP